MDSRIITFHHTEIEEYKFNQSFNIQFLVQ